MSCHKLMMFCNHLSEDIKLFFRTLLKKRSVKYTERLKPVYTITIGLYEKQIDAIKDAARIEKIVNKKTGIQIKAILVNKSLLIDGDSQDKVL